jgi:heme/copper-type cytochrome/quinol oxidase subunit 3
MVLFFHQYATAGTLLRRALICLVYVASLWWRDVVREGVLGFHTRKVKNGLHLGMLLFIWSETMFFVGFLWRFMHAALMPTIQVGMSWPPLGIVPLHWTGLPKTNTLILLRSYFTANGRKHALENSQKNLCGTYLLLTIGLGRLFMYCQYIEYTSAPFTFSDTVYGSRFYLTTGFHGFHVFVGRVYLAVCFFLLKETERKKAVAFNLAVLYWHFVDLVWAALLVILYVWGSRVPTYEIEACTDGVCV